jgi:hypothetical protein
MRSAIIAIACALLAGCEPCAGTVGCISAPRIALQGRLLDDATGAAVPGATIDIIRTGGVSLEADSLRVQTDEEGLFFIEAEATDAGVVQADVVVRLPDGSGYRIPEQRFDAVSRNGEAQVLPPWSTRLRLPDLAIAFRRGYPPKTMESARIEFRQTAGPALDGVVNGVYRTTTGSDGFFYLFGGTVTPRDAGEVVGDLIIDAQPTPTVHAGVRIPVRHEFRAAATLRTFGAGPNLSYHIAVNDRGRAGVHVPGVRVEFVRTGGAPIAPESWDMTTDATGRVFFPVLALDTGVLRGNLRIIPPSPWKAYDLIGVELPTYDEDRAILFAVLGVGPGLPYYVVIRKNGVPLAGVTVSFERISGIAVTPSSFSSVTNDSGIVNVTPTPHSEGELVADVTVRPPQPHATFTVRGLRLQALDADRPGGRVLLGDWDVTAPPAIRQP